MGLFNKQEEARHTREFRRKLKRVSSRDLLDLTEAHIGEISMAVLAMRTRPDDQYNDALWEAQRLTDELVVLLDELDSLA
jgi:hypothetical protein